MLAFARDVIERFGIPLEALWSPRAFLIATVISVALLVVSALCVAWIVHHLPEDYLLASSDGPTLRSMRVGHVLRNLLGLLLILLGVVMLVLPGQGLLTLLVGISMLDFPKRKRELERRLISRPPVLATINRLRHRAGRPPLRLPERS